MNQTAFINLDLQENYKVLSHNLKSQIIFSSVFFILWAALSAIINYACEFKSLSVKESNDVKNRIVSIVHGSLTFWLAASQYLPYPTFNQPNTNFQTLVILLSLSYCLYDLMACIYYRLADISVIAHHIFCILGFSSVISAGYGTIDAIGGLFIGEASNFSMHLRFILRSLNLKNTKAHEYSQNVFLFSYIIFRGILCPFILWYPSLVSPNSPWVVTLMGSFLMIQSYFFIYKMVSGLNKKAQRYKQMSEKKIQFKWIQQNPEQLQKLSFYKTKQSSKTF